jgi:poly(3-hydroxybutyrate) depolymerase
VITGTAQQGQTLTTSTGTWTNSPTAYQYNWFDCSGTSPYWNCTVIPNASSATYVASAADVGFTLRTQVKAQNSSGWSAWATSAPTSVVTAPGPVPTNTAAPAITGTAQEGQTLTTSTGTWTNSPTAYQYNWFDCSGTSPYWNCNVIPNTNSTTYTPTASDIGYTLRTQVKAWNSSGWSAWATSAPTAAVIGAPCTPSPCTNGTEQVYSVTSDDGAGLQVTRTFSVWRPAHLTNDSLHRVALVFGFQNNQNWAGESSSTAAWDCAVLDCTYVQMDPTHSGQYSDPTIAPGTGSFTCGSSGTADCDDIPEVQAILARVECSGALPCQNVDTSRVYFTGGSKGGAMTQDVMCDPRSSADGHGYATVSNTLIDFTAQNPPANPSCPALFGTSPNTDLSLLWIYGTNDGSFNGNGLDVGFWDNHTPPRWWYSNPQLATSVFGTVLGCPSTPSSVTTLGNTGQWTYSVYSPCTHTGVATGTYRGNGAGHIPEGYDGLDLAMAAWNFWAAHPG